MFNFRFSSLALPIEGYFFGDGIANPGNGMSVTFLKNDSTIRVSFSSRMSRLLLLQLLLRRHFVKLNILNFVGNIRKGGEEDGFERRSPQRSCQYKLEAKEKIQYRTQ